MSHLRFALRNTAMQLRNSRVNVRFWLINRLCRFICKGEKKRNSYLIFQFISSLFARRRRAIGRMAVKFPYCLGMARLLVFERMFNTRRTCRLRDETRAVERITHIRLDSRRSGRYRDFEDRTACYRAPIETDKVNFTGLEGTPVPEGTAGVE
jgi:hypothetical protein